MWEKANNDSESVKGESINPLQVVTQLVRNVSVRRGV